VSAVLCGLHGAPWRQMTDGKLLLCWRRSEKPVVVVEKVIGEGVKVKVVELGLTVVLSQRNKIFIKVSSF